MYNLEYNFNIPPITGLNLYVFVCFVFFMCHLLLHPISGSVFDIFECVSSHLESELPFSLSSGFMWTKLKMVHDPFSKVSCL